MDANVLSAFTLLHTFKNSIMRTIQQLTTVIFSALLLTSCIKESVPGTQFACSAPVFASSATKDLLTAHTWQIDEIVDPFQEIRYKRGVISDAKDFAIARYTYHDDQSITGMDWFGQPLEHHYYSLQDQEQHLKFITPTCCSIAAIIKINESEFSYKSADGSIFKLVPAAQSQPTTGTK